MNLYTILGQDTLPEQVEKNKQNIAILAEEVDKLGFTPKGVYDADTEYNYNDLVFYDEKMYAVISEVAIVGVLPTNTTYWQQVTGSIMGQQGPQGIQGPQGPAGADGQDGQDGTNGTNGTNGKDALAYGYIADVVGNPQGRLLSLDKAAFNRTPVENERVTIFIRDTASNDIYATNGTIASVATSYATYGVTTAYKITGATGAAGPSALCYDRNIAFTRTEDAEQLISVTLPFANFNRDPELNQDFVAILEDTGVCYVAQCEVQSISGTNVTSIVASDINRITGADGQNGTNGTDGESALVCKSIHTSSSNYPYVGLTFVELKTNFNREPKLNDFCNIVWKFTATNQSYICVAEVTSVDGDGTPHFTSRAYVETTGASASSNFEHYVTLTNTSGTLTDSDYNKLLQKDSIIIYNDGLYAKDYDAGNVMYFRSVIKLSGVPKLETFSVYNSKAYTFSTENLASPTLYRHYIKIAISSGRQCYIGFDIINQTSTALTLTAIKTFLTNITNSAILNISGIVEQSSGSGTYQTAYNLFRNNDNALVIQSVKPTGSTDAYILNDTYITVNDYVLTL